ncbi:MAG: flagellar hook-length control protein FliK, partial [Porcipelethomonas sp.]
QTMPQNSEVPQMQFTPQNGEVPQMQTMPQNSEIPQMQFTPQDSEIPQMQFTPQNGEVPQMQTMPQNSEVPQMQFTPQNGEVPQMQTMPQNSEVPQMQFTPQNSEVPQTQIMPQNSEILQTQFVPQNGETSRVQDEPHDSEIPQPPKMQLMPQGENDLEISEILIQPEFTQNVQETVSDKLSDSSERFEIPVMQPDADTLSDKPADVRDQKVSENTPDSPDVLNNTADPAYTSDVPGQYGKVQTGQGMYIANAPDAEKSVQHENFQHTENNYEASEKQPVDNKESDLFGMPFMYSRDSENAVFTDNPLAKQFEDIFSVLTPKLNSYSSDKQSKGFTMDLMNAMGDERKVKDSFDFSESVIKADPFQLAGLLDFVSTGMGIPPAADMTGSEMLKNIQNVPAPDAGTGRIVFDPEEMIRSGEMEIVSYVPADKNAQSGMSQENMSQSGEKTIDFARTMKSVRDNVRPKYSDEEELVSEVSQMTVEDMDRSAERIDISFERAYAELEMNKAKYGSADEQLFKGISENLSKGKSEFTVKLRPEGLGEILVKLVSEDGGKTVLSMVASSAKTAALLNRDLASLQTSLSQHDVEIENNSVRTAETVMAASSSFSQYDERRQDEGRQQNQFRELRKKIGDISLVNPSFEGETEADIKPDLNPALNITI